jgi:hypothetical protein
MLLSLIFRDTSVKDRPRQTKIILFKDISDPS